MPLHPTLADVCLRLVLAFAAAFAVGFNRGERNEAVGLRTTLLVCMAAALAGVLANLLLSTTGKEQHDFAQIDVLRLPLGILSGIGFIGAGAIIKKGDVALGVTTAATMWAMSVIGLCFGTGFYGLGVAGTGMALAILWPLKWFDKAIPRALRCTLTVEALPSLTEDQLYAVVKACGFSILSWSAEYRDEGENRFSAVLQWRGREEEAGRPAAIAPKLAGMPDIKSVAWKPVDPGS